MTTAYPFIYGKGRQFQYGVELISPALAPVARELEGLAAYASRTNSRSIRYGHLSQGDTYLSFAFSLPQGSTVDRRAQARIITFVFPKDDEQICPLTPALLQALPALTMKEVEALARSGDTVAVEAFHPGTPVALPPPSPALLTAVIATLFFQKTKAGHPALMAQTDPMELLATLSVLPPWLLEEVTFNTDVQAVSEPLQLVNAWTIQAKQKAERTSYSGATRNQRRFFYPNEDGARLYVDGLEREAARFLHLSPAQQEALYEDCDRDLAALINHLRCAEEKDVTLARYDPSSHHKDRKDTPSISADLCRSLSLVALLFCGVFSLYSVLTPLLLSLWVSVLSFLGAASLGWSIFRLAEHLGRFPLEQHFTKIRTRGIPEDCRRLQRVCKVLRAAATAGMFLLLLGVLTAIAVAAASAFDGSALPQVLLPILLAGHGLGALLWFIKFVTQLREACLARLEEVSSHEENQEDLTC